MYGRKSEAAEDSGSVDWSVNRPCTERAHGETGLGVDRPFDPPRAATQEHVGTVDRPEGQNWLNITSG